MKIKACFFVSIKFATIKDPNTGSCIYLFPGKYYRAALGKIYISDNKEEMNNYITGLFSPNQKVSYLAKIEL